MRGNAGVRSVLSLPIVLAASIAGAQPWQPPLGIPMPPFGIFEQSGPFTHYVDNTHPNATDTGNPNGSPSLPRRTVPTTIAAGAVIEVRGGPYQISQVTWTANGTAAAPSFVKGIGGPLFVGTPPISSADELRIQGGHLVVEGLIFDGAKIRTLATTRVIFRYNEVRNYSPTSNSSAVDLGGTENVIFANHIHHNGDLSSTTELDIHGVKMGEGDNRIWILDNHIHHNAGDSVQIGSAVAPEPWARFIYIGRNLMHEDVENAVDIKQARDVVVSQNRIYGYVPSASGSSGGTALVAHNDPDRVWILFNMVSDSTDGIVSTGTQDGFYVIGNVIWNIRHDPSDPSYDPDSMFETAGIHARATPHVYAINNTIHGSDSGIGVPNGSHVEVVNNVVAGLTQPSHHVAIGASSSSHQLRNNVLDATARIRFGSSTVRNCTQTQAAFPSQVSQCINANPQLVNPASADFHIAGTSPAVNTGLNAHAAYARYLGLYGVDISRDHDGVGRPVGPAFDIGAYEIAAVVSVLDATLAEGHYTPLTHAVPLALSGSSPVPIQVNYNVTAGTATAGVDFVAGPGSVVIPPFATSYTLPVSILPDLMDENNETYNVTLTGSTNAILGDAQAVVTIADDDAPPELVVSDCGVVEGDAGSTPCRFGVSLTAPSSFPVSVSYATASGSAAAGQDFTAASGTITFPPGTSASQAVDVAVAGDGAIEFDEAFTLNLSSPQNASAPDQGEGLILDDDAPALSSDELLHGWTVVADLASAGAPDADHYRIAQPARSSWEVVVDEVSGDVAPGLVLERLGSDNTTVLQTAQAVGTGTARSLRWEHASAADAMHQTLRVRSTGCTTSCDADDRYRLRLYETTMTMARFNNIQNNISVVIVQNPNPFQVNGTLWFWSPAGVLVYARSFVTPARGVYQLHPLLNAPLLGQAGTVTLTSNAPFGTLRAKGVTIDSQGGFAFDTPFEHKLK